MVAIECMQRQNTVIVHVLLLISAFDFKSSFTCPHSHPAIFNEHDYASPHRE